MVLYFGNHIPENCHTIDYSETLVITWTKVNETNRHGWYRWTWRHLADQDILISGRRWIFHQDVSDENVEMIIKACRKFDKFQ